MAAAVAEAAQNLRRVRAGILAATLMSLERALRTLELPGANRLRDAQAALDRAVGEAYCWGLPRELAGLEPLPLLLALNRRCAAAEGDGRLSSDECLRMRSPGSP